MIDKKFFSQLQKKYTAYVDGRNDIIVQSRDILKLSKQAIFACHRNELDVADKSLKEAFVIMSYLLKKIAKNQDLSGEGSFLAALEEYAEARLFFVYLTTEKVGALQEVELPYDTYIGALSDFTGELTRKAVWYATRRDVVNVEKIRTVIEDIMEQFIKFDLRSHLRSKYDAARKNLRQVEEILYDLEISKK